MRNTFGLKKVAAQGILPLFILSILAVSSPAFAAAGLKKNIAALVRKSG